MSLLNQYLDPHYKAWNLSLISFNAKFSCTNTKCYSVMWSSSRATMQFNYKCISPGVYHIVIRGYKRVCAKCHTKSDVEFENQDEEDLERIVKFMALKLSLYIKSDKHQSKKFFLSREDMLDELSYYKPIDEISKSMKYYHSLHVDECCACFHDFCVYHAIPEDGGEN